ncbi:hypothetical protein [Acrocarpospora phusangensis]|uniref:hypothetical protein n=1 Tax=Acrocarpospora phusangensis TaxID=1070424 RepID=UPI0019514CDB|nr:hypothetical protein [Acrocarpospora phusangensis]
MIDAAAGVIVSELIVSDQRADELDVVSVRIMQREPLEVDPAMAVIALVAEGVMPEQIVPRRRPGWAGGGGG